MASSRLSSRQITAQERLRALVTRGVSLIWQGLPGYDEDNVAQWLAAVLPLAMAANRQSVALTDAYIARVFGRQPLGLDPAMILAALRGGVDPKVLYRRPFVTVWTALSKGTPWEQAVSAGGARATETAAADVQLAQRATLQAVQDADPRIRGYQRVPDAGACPFCLNIAGAFVKSADAMPLHPHCGCTLEPVEDDVESTPTPADVAVNDHGELGLLLGDPSHDFTTL